MEDDEESCSLFLDDEEAKGDPKEDSELELYKKFLNYILIQCSRDKFLEWKWEPISFKLLKVPVVRQQSVAEQAKEEFLQTHVRRCSQAAPHGSGACKDARQE